MPLMTPASRSLHTTSRTRMLPRPPTRCRRNPRGLILVHRIRKRAHGQAIVMMAMILPVLLMFVLCFIEIGGRVLQRNEVEAALRNASRSAVQTFAYERFAENTQALKASTPCTGTVSGGCAGNPVAKLAADLFATNLTHVAGLAASETPKTVADRVVWTIGPRGGACLGQSYDTPMVCAQLNVPMRGLVGWGNWTPQMTAAEKIDRFETP